MNGIAYSDHSAPDHGLRLIALLEFSKGALTVLAGFGLLSLIHHDVQRIAEELVAHLHLNPASQYPRIFIDAASEINDGNLKLLALMAFGYACVRFTEAYGLWQDKVWAEWFGALSGSIYIPFELYELAKGMSTLKVITLLINVVIVGTLARRLRQRVASSNPLESSL
jgi:uncharacterized membrane protein (DUF2068 family)